MSIADYITKEKLTREYFIKMFERNDEDDLDSWK